MTTATASWDDFAASLHGSLVMAGDAEFAATRKPFLGRVEEVLPQAVARCADVDDVVRAVGFARDRGLPLAVRSGGHSFADFSTTSGLLIDLGSLDSVRCDGESATAGPGVRLGALAQRLAGHGRIVPCGWNPLVAVGGAVLGGGYGALSRNYGLGCDHLLAAQVVLADGSVIWTDEHREPDLFWALRGAGWGSFGVVTALTLRTHPAPPVTTFVHRWPWADAARAVDAWQRWAPWAPDEVNAELVIQALGRSEPRITLFGATLQPAAQARGLLTEFIRTVDPAAELDELTELSRSAAPIRHTYAGAGVMEQAQPGPPMGMRPWMRAVRSEFFAEPMPMAGITALLEAFASDRRDGQFRELEFIPWAGAFAKVAPEATAFAHRDCLFQIGHHAMVPNPADDEARSAAQEWARRSWRAVHEQAAGKVYPNYPDLDLTDWAEAYYGKNLSRLQQVKANYDPDDLFHFAHSVPLPTGTARSG